MRPHNLESNAMKALIKKAAAAPSMSSEGKEKIYSRIAEFAQKKASASNPLLSLTFNPALGLFIVVPLFLLFAAFGTFQVFLTPGYVQPSLVFVSGSAYVADGGQKALSIGENLEERSTIRVPESRICDLAIEDKVNMRLFPESDFSVSGYGSSSPRMTMSLGRGSLYIDKRKNLDRGKIIEVRIRDYLFVLEGTRVLFQGFEKRIRVFCFEGRVKVMLNDRGLQREIFSLREREKIEIVTDGEKRNYNIDDFLSDQAMRFDSDFIGFPALDPSMLARYSSLLETPVHEKNAAPNKTEVGTGKGEVAAEMKTEKEPYTITSIGTIKDASIANNAINFIASVQDASVAYVITQSSLYVLSDDKVKEAIRFSETPIFKVKPILAGDTLALVSTRNIYLIERGTLSIKSRITLPDSGSAEDNYYPQYWKGVLYVPVLNNGYYSVKIDDPRPGLYRFYKEMFPITPVIVDEGIFVGSSYANYVAFIDGKGTILWKYTLDGKSFSNMATSGNDIFVYALRNNKPLILAIDGNGKKKHEWQIAREVVSDLSVSGKNIFGYYSNGELFSLDSGTGVLSTIDKLFATKLSNKALRTVEPLVENNFLYAGTDSGELFVYDVGEKTVVERITIKADEKFFATPVKINDAIYLVSNSGNVYKAVKNDR